MTSRDIALAASLDASARAVPLQHVLGEMLADSALSRRDRALAGEIALGALRRRMQTDLVLAHASSRPLAGIQPPLLEALRQAAYQVLFLDRVPAHAAVNETVGIVKRRLGEKPAAFANAVLRATSRMVAEKNIPRPEGDDLRRALFARDGRFVLLAEPVVAAPPENFARWLAEAYGYPVFLLERWVAHHGPERAERIAAWGDTTPPVTVRLNPRKTSGWPLPEKEAAKVFGDCTGFAPGEVEGTYRVEPKVAPAELAGLRDGLYAIQDETQARPAYVLAPPEGATVLDLCSGLGTKSTQLAGLVGPRGNVVAVEIDAEKLLLAQGAALRQGHSNIANVRADALSLAGPAAREYTHVLVDAPCSNLGSLDRRPEVRFRTTVDDIRSLAEDELDLLKAAAGYVAGRSPPGASRNPEAEPPGGGGALVYSVCSFEPEETHEVVRRFLGARADFSLEAEHLVLPEPGLRDGGYAARLVRSGEQGGGRT